MTLQPADGWRQQLPTEAGRVGSPQSAPVQPGTAGPCYRLCRRRGQSGIQLHRGDPRIPLAAPLRVVREEELAGRFLAVKGAVHDL